MRWLNDLGRWARWWWEPPKLESSESARRAPGVEAARIIAEAMSELSRPTGPTPCIVVMNDELGDWGKLYWLLVFSGRDRDAAEIAGIKMSPEALVWRAPQRREGPRA